MFTPERMNLYDIMLAWVLCTAVKDFPEPRDKVSFLSTLPLLDFVLETNPTPWLS